MILEKLREKTIVIYGTGHVARKFYRIMQTHGLEKQVLCFVRSQKTEGEAFEGLPVFSLEELSFREDTLICLAVHESIREEIEILVRRKTKQYMWIYPYLYELMFGPPEKRELKLQVKELLSGFQEDLRLGVRLAAIEQQEGRNDWGFSCYIRAQTLHCSEATAKRRLEQFRSLIVSWKSSGYEEASRLVLNRSYGVIDGNHRLSMAVYMGQETIYGDVYPTDLSVEEVHGREPMQSESLLLHHGFTTFETEALKRIQRNYLGVYENG